MNIKKSLLKKLIKEVIKEVDATLSEPSQPQVGASDDTMKHSIEAEKHKGDLMVKLSLRGVKSGPALKKFLGRLAHDAKMADLQAIHAEIEKAGGKKIASMDISDLEANRPEDEEDKWDISPYKKKAPPIEPGSGEAEWKAMTARDMAAARAKAKARKAQGLPPEDDDED